MLQCTAMHMFGCKLLTAAVLYSARTWQRCTRCKKLLTVLELSFGSEDSHHAYVLPATCHDVSDQPLVIERCVDVWLHAVPARLADECVPCVML